MTTATTIEQLVTALLNAPNGVAGLSWEDAGTIDAILGDLLQGFPQFASMALSSEQDVNSADVLNAMMTALGIKTSAVVEEDTVARLLHEHSVVTLLASLADELDIVQGLVEEISTRPLSSEETLKVRQIEAYLGSLMLSVMALERAEGKGYAATSAAPLRRSWLDHAKAILLYKFF
ncbi:MAG TPA: hypothetical protein V6C88_01945 [Chroococcidiopsis sp.]